MSFIAEFEPSANIPEGGGCVACIGCRVYGVGRRVEGGGSGG
jgi:hypothetical protein